MRPSLHPILDTERVHSLRIGAGLTEKDLAGRLGLSPPVVRRLEEGTNHEQLSVRDLVRLADVLGVEPAVLFRERNQAPDPRTAGRHPDDAEKAGAALATLRKKIRTDDLSHALHWPRPRTQAALAALAQRVQACGLDVQRTPLGHRLVRREGVLTKDEERAIENRSVAHASVETDAARMLRRIWIDGLTRAQSAQLTQTQCDVLAKLLRRGWVEQASGGYTLSLRTAASLGDASAAQLPPSRSRKRGTQGVQDPSLPQPNDDRG